MQRKKRSWWDLPVLVGAAWVATLAGLATASAQAGAPPAAPPPTAEQPAEAPGQVQALAAPTRPAPRPQKGTPFPVGQWPEGVVVASGSVWVAQSGERTVARLDPTTGRVEATVKIGRLPVAMGVDAEGAPIVQVNTNKRMARIDPKTNKAKVLVTFPDGPEDTAVEGGFAYTLLWQRDSSAGSSVFRTDLKTRKTLRSKDTGANAFALTVGGGVVWIARTDGAVVALDAQTLAPKGEVRVGGRPFHLAFGAGAAFVGGETVVARLSPETRTETHRATLDGRVYALAAYADHVVAATQDGTLWLLDPGTLAIQAQLTPPAAYAPQAVARDGQVLYVSTHQATGVRPASGTLWRIPID